MTGCKSNQNTQIKSAFKIGLAGALLINADLILSFSLVYQCTQKQQIKGLAHACSGTKSEERLNACCMPSWEGLWRHMDTHASHNKKHDA